MTHHLSPRSRGCILTLLQSAISNVRGTRKTNIQCTKDHQSQCPNVQLLLFIDSHRAHGDITSQRVHHVRGFLIHFFTNSRISFTNSRIDCTDLLNGQMEKGSSCNDMQYLFPYWYSYKYGRGRVSDLLLNMMKPTNAARKKIFTMVVLWPPSQSSSDALLVLKRI